MNSQLFNMCSQDLFSVNQAAIKHHSKRAAIVVQDVWPIEPVGNGVRCLPPDSEPSAWRQPMSPKCDSSTYDAFPVSIKHNGSLVHAAVIAATTANESFSLPLVVMPTV
jgi:hypothetical protein